MWSGGTCPHPKSQIKFIRNDVVRVLATHTPKGYDMVHMISTYPLSESLFWFGQQHYNFYHSILSQSATEAFSVNQPLNIWPCNKRAHIWNCISSFLDRTIKMVKKTWVNFLPFKLDSFKVKIPFLFYCFFFLGYITIQFSFTQAFYILFPIYCQGKIAKASAIYQANSMKSKEGKQIHSIFSFLLNHPRENDSPYTMT